MECIRRKSEFDIKKKSETLHLLTGLSKILLDIDKAIRIIRNTEQESQVVPNLMKGFGIDNAQAEFIAEIKLRNLNREYILRQTADIEKLKNEIEDLKDIVAHDARVLDIICSQLEGVSRKYGQERKTEIIDEEHIEEVTPDNLIEDYNVRLVLTDEGYIKKIPLVSLRSSGEQKLKDDDFIIQEADTHNKAELLLFSNKYVVYKAKVYEFPDGKASQLGEYLNNILNLEPGEKIIKMHPTDDYKGYFLFAYENGKMSKVPVSSYETRTNRKKLSNAYNDLSPLVGIFYLEEDKDFVAFSSIDKVLVFNTSQINPKTTRDSQGVWVLKSKKGSTLRKIMPLNEADLKDPEYYRANIPAIGYYLKEEDKEVIQIGLF